MPPIAASASAPASGWFRDISFLHGSGRRWFSRASILLILSAAAVLAPPSAGATRWFVGSNPRGPGFLSSIQQAVDLAADEDTIEVGPGIFHERVSIVEKTLLVRGAGRELTEVTSFPEGNTFALRGYGNYTEIRSLTITNASADNGSDPAGGIYGGAVLGDGAVFALVDCHLSGNYAQSLGGAVYATSRRIVPDDFAPTKPGRPARLPGVEHEVILVRECTLEGNTAGAEGGALAFEDAFFVVEDCVIRGNLTGHGGGLWSFNSTGRISRCLFQGNEAVLDGGALDTQEDFFHETTSLLIEENTIAGNVAGRWGAAAYITRGLTISYERNIFSGNGGAANSVIGCGVQDAEYQGGCNDFWANVPPALDGCVALTDDRAENPYFCGESTGDFRLCQDSPLLSTPCGPIGAYGAGCSGAGCATAVRPVTWSGVKTLVR